MNTSCAVVQVLMSLLVAWPVAGRLTASAVDTYPIDPAASQVTIDVGKAGMLSFAGHTHRVVGPIEGGTVDFDREDPSRSHVRLVIATAALQVSGEGEPRDDVPKVQQAMDGEKVLDISRYPRIVFESTSVERSTTHRSTTDRSTRQAAPEASREGQPRAANAIDLVLVVRGSLTIRDVSRPIGVPIHVELAGNAITATGRFSVKQTTYGITPITVAGVVSVKDALDIRFRIVARR